MVDILPYKLYLVCCIMTVGRFKVKKINKQHLSYYDCVNTVQMLSQLVWFGFFLVSHSQHSNVIFAENLKEASQHENQIHFLLLYANSCLNSFHNFVCCFHISSIHSSTLRANKIWFHGPVHPLPVSVWFTI